jgi:hypothetical protein
LTISTIGNGSTNNENVVWVYDLNVGSALRRLTFTGVDAYPQWDGRDVIFSSLAENGLFRQSADGS